MRGFKKSTPLTVEECNLVLKIVFESRNLHGTDFEKLVTIVQKMQLTIQEKKEDK